MSNKAKGWLLAAALFGIGGAVGWFGHGAWAVRQGGDFRRVQFQGPQQLVLERMTHDLGLNPDQRAQVGLLLTEMFDRIGELRKPIMDQEGAILDEYMSGRIRDVLTAEQAARHDKQLEHLREMRKRMGSMPPLGGPPPGPGPQPGPQPGTELGPPPGAPFGAPPGPPPGAPPGPPPGDRLGGPPPGDTPGMSPGDRPGAPRPDHSGPGRSGPGGPGSAGAGPGSSGPGRDGGAGGCCGR